MDAQVYNDSVEFSRPDPEPWMEDSVCNEDDTELFFPEKRGATYEKGKELCSMCPVRMECLAWILNIEKTGSRRHGLVAGYEPAERKRLQDRLDALAKAQRKEEK